VTREEVGRIRIGLGVSPIRPAVLAVNSSSSPEVALVDSSERLVLSVAEAAELLGISRTLAYDLVARHELPALRLGGRIVIPRRPLERLLDGESAHAELSVVPSSLRAS
jgi:excisionase family DNA binding protein